MAKITVNEESLRQQISLGWIAALLVLTIGLEAMIIQGLFTDQDLLALRVDPGSSGLTILKYLSAIHVVMAIAVYTPVVRFGFARWAFVGVAGLMLVVFVLHHLSHWVFGQRPDFTSHVMDLLHHLTMGWVLYNSIRLRRIWRSVEQGAAIDTSSRLLTSAGSGDGHVGSANR